MRLRKLEMDGHIFIGVIWFAGTRMINQGADGLSRGDFTVGVMAGHRFLRFLPLNKNVLERQKDFSRNFERGLPGKKTGSGLMRRAGSKKRTRMIRDATFGALRRH
jgi:hypothetical protein